MRTRTYEQLERFYNRFDAKNNNEPMSLYDRVLEEWWASCSPKDSICDYYFGLNLAGRRRLLGEFARKLEHDLFETMLEQLEIIE